MKVSDNSFDEFFFYSLNVCYVFIFLRSYLLHSIYLQHCCATSVIMMSNDDRVDLTVMQNIVTDVNNCQKKGKHPPKYNL